MGGNKTTKKKKFVFPSLYEIRKKRLKKAIKMHELNKQYYEMEQEVQAYKKLANQGVFSRRTIIFCLSFLAFFALLCLYVEYKAAQLGIQIETYLLFRTLAAVFGGELLFLLFKRIYTSDDNKIKNFVDRFSKKKNNKTNSTAEEVACSTKLKDVNNTDGFIDSSIYDNEEYSNNQAANAMQNIVSEVNNSIKGGLG